jgi:hypothetical protein
MIARAIIQRNLSIEDTQDTLGDMNKMLLLEICSAFVQNPGYCVNHK